MLVRAFRFPYQPVNAHLIPIRRCNLSCAYCNEYDDHSLPVPTRDLIRRIDRLAALGTGVVTLSGGEPLLHPDLDEIIRRIRGHGVIATLITNGYLLSRDRIRRLNRAGLDHLQICSAIPPPEELRAPVHGGLCAQGVAQVDELRRNPQAALSQWFPASRHGERARLPPAVRMLMWAFVTSPQRDLFRDLAVRVSGAYVVGR